MADFSWQDALASRSGNDALLVNDHRNWTGQDIAVELRMLTERLKSSRVVGVLADNSPAWVIADLAIQDAGRVHLPLPAFFHEQQLRAALEQAGADTVLTDTPERVGALDLGFAITGHWQGLTWMRRVVEPVTLPTGTAKISFTSGSTGMPKGVCLSAAGLLDTAHAVHSRLADLPLGRHLAVLPLALLLENVAGVYAPLLRGTTVHLPSLEALGWAGMQGFDPVLLDRQVRETAAASVVLVPELLKAWVGLLGASELAPPATLQFVAVGGARIAPELIADARARGLPAYQGYGLTEGGSVLAINRPGDDGSGVGRPLNPDQLGIKNGELVVTNRIFLGYLGSVGQSTMGSSLTRPSHPPAAPLSESPSAPLLPFAGFATGDLASFDATGHLHLEGRRKHVLITSFGRNISPEWVEAALLAQPEIAQTIVTGEGEPALTAIVVPSPEIDPAALGEAIARTNSGLPDYARVAFFITTPAFTMRNGLATANGRPRRQAIIDHHRAALKARHGHKEPLLSVYAQIKSETQSARAHLLEAPIIRACLAGEASLDGYLAFLAQAYHHVRHTTPLLMSLGGRLPERLAWMQASVAEYIEEELGHEAWILADIRAAGGDPEAVRLSRPDLPAELMVAYAYDLIARGNPAAFFGMVFVLEGTSVELALTAADRIQAALGLPNSAFTYLRSHGTLDQEHTQHLANILEKMAASDQADVLHAAKVFYTLYGDLFHALPVEVAACN